MIFDIIYLAFAPARDDGSLSSQRRDLRRQLYAVGGPTWENSTFCAEEDPDLVEPFSATGSGCATIYSIYIASWCRGAALCLATWDIFRNGRGCRSDTARAVARRRSPRRTGMSLEFALCLVTLFVLAGIGTPIAYAIMLASFVYLASGGGIGMAGKVLMDGLYNSFILLAVPLFIVAANIMNAGTITDRLLRFCVGLVGRFKGGLGHVNVVASLIFSGMSGSAVADAAGIGKIIIEMMTKRPLHPWIRRRDHGGLGHHWPDHPAVDPDGAVRARLEHLDRLPVSGWHCSGPVHGGRPDGDELFHLAPARVRCRGAGAARELPA